jgi:RHS repeat-associated protein
VDAETGYVGVGCGGRGVPEVCQYDPAGRLLWPCGDIGSLGYDGENVVRTGDDDSTLDWTFVHGPGTDDPLMGMLGRGIGQDPVYLYWVTDGGGRQYGVGNASGHDYLGENDYINKGKWAGGTRLAHSFGAERNPSGEMLGLSFFRNRFYDQETGRWTQEDPIGLAAGTNLYAYVGNDPASYLDPFGLQPCDPPGSCTLQRTLAVGAVGATAGGAVAAGCTLATGGVCALGAPAIVLGGAAVGSTIGLASGLAEDLSASVNFDLGDIRKKIGPFVTGILIRLGGGRPESKEDKVLEEDSQRPRAEVIEEKAKKEKEKEPSE